MYMHYSAAQPTKLAAAFGAARKVQEVVGEAVVLKAAEMLRVGLAFM